MRRKLAPKPETVVPAEIIEQATRLIAVDTSKALARCEVCGAEAPAGHPDNLCWVCRRLKISAWRDSEQQMPAQE